MNNKPKKLSYNKLWKLLIDKDMNKQDLIKLTGLSSSSIAKLSKGKNVNTSTLIRICETLNCDLSEIVSIINSD